ncbi:MAG: hypothetical protein J5862_00260 [Bacteroidales bacterium]|nr:hypothetical protein [Bacteroidales bacterium]
MKLSVKIFLPLMVLFFLCVNHFDGFEQDCILYTLQAINRIFPGRFIDDPAFMFGNQDAFSIFSPLYAFFIKMLPIDKVALLLTLFIHSGVATSFAWLSYKWTKKFHCPQLALPVTLFFFSMYAYGEFRNDMWGTIKTIEAFPVARTLSVCFGFWGLAHLFDKNKWITPVVFLAGSLIHPLTAGWGLPLWLFFHYPKIRLPIVIAAALFPATIFIDKVPWAAYPEKWCHIGWDMDGVVPLVQNLILNLLFLILVSVKFVQSKSLKKFAQAQTFVAGIAIYWFAMSIFTHHIFLFQVQTFRILWLCQVSAVFIQFFVAMRLYVLKLRKDKPLDIWDKVFILIAVVYWIDSLFVVIGAIVAAILFAIRNKSSFGKVRGILVCVWLAVTAFPMYWIVFLHWQPLPELYASYLIFIQELFATAAALAFVVHIICPKWRTVVIAVMVLCAVVILWGNLIFPRQNFSLAFVLAVAAYGFVRLVLSLRNVAGKAISVSTLIALLIGCAVVNYDHRDNAQKEREHAMNQFVKAPPFPDIEKRGRILYSVQDFAGKLPRIHFLSGAYYDEQYEVGSIFF